ncbi:MAG: carbohydrate kinase family protein [Candidatus Izemoplasmatales bacterium]
MNFQQSIPMTGNKSIDVLFVGEILVDIISDADTSTVKKYYGGSPANIALNMKRLGSQVKLYSAVGNDLDGEFLEQQLKSLEIPYHLDHVIGSTSTVEINKSNTTPIPTFHRDADYKIELSNELINDIDHSKILHFSYWPISMDSSRQVIYQLIKESKKNKTVIGFDPNYHNLIDNLERKGLQSLKEILSYVDIIKPSLDDSIRIFGEGFTIHEYLDKFQELGCQLIIMTLGNQGLIAKYKDSVISFPSKATEVIDTTGAGDAFWSGLYAGITDSLSLETSIQLGLLCSAYNLRVVGADAFLPPLEVLKKEL